MGAFKDLSGTKIGDWYVIKRASNIGTSTRWHCKCECGTERVVRAAHLSSGASTCCGCKVHVVKHGGARKPSKHGEATNEKPFSKKYRTWRYIKSRCCDPKHKNASIYNGLLCDRWLTYTNFASDVPDPPNDDLTIDRIDNTKGYEPGNVRWATWTEQHRNQSNCRWIEFKGERMLLTDWAKYLGVTPSTLHGRIEKWGVDTAFDGFTPKNCRVSPDLERAICLDTRPYKTIATHYGVHHATVYRVKRRNTKKLL